MSPSVPWWENVPSLSVKVNEIENHPLLQINRRKRAAHPTFNTWEERHSSHRYFRSCQACDLEAFAAQTTVIFRTSSFPAVRTQLPFHNTSKLRQSNSLCRPQHPSLCHMAFLSGVLAPPKGPREHRRRAGAARKPFRCVKISARLLDERLQKRRRETPDANHVFVQTTVRGWRRDEFQHANSLIYTIKLNFDDASVYK